MHAPGLTSVPTSGIPAWSAMSVDHPERLPAANRLRAPREHAAVKAEGTSVRGRFCLLRVLPRPGEPTKIGFIASRKGVGDAVERNRARRRLREIVRRRWPRIPKSGYWMNFIAFSGVLGAPHDALATDVEHVLAAAGALRPIAGWSA